MTETIRNIGDENLFIWENAINYKTTHTKWQIGLKISNQKYSLPANKHKCILFQNSEKHYESMI